MDKMNTLNGVTNYLILLDMSKWQTYKRVKFSCIFSGVFLCWCACSVGSGKSGGITELRKDNALIENFWEAYDFMDTIRLCRSDAVEKMLVDYLIQLSKLTERRACEEIRNLVLKTSANPVVNRWFLQRLEHHLFEPDSPLRNDNYYISVLEEALASGYLNGMMRVRPLYQLKMLQKNRIGTRAANFTITLSTGQIRSLWDISAQYTLFLFYDPSCIHCRETIRELSESSVIKTFLSHREYTLPQLTLITVCVEGDMNAWKEYQSFLPSTWINGYDAKNVFVEDEIYFLRSFPSIYLLGEDKQVLLKETSINEIMRYLSNIQKNNDVIEDGLCNH